MKIHKWSGYSAVNSRVMVTLYYSESCIGWRDYPHVRGIVQLQLNNLFGKLSTHGEILVCFSIWHHLSFTPILLLQDELSAGVRSVVQES